MNRRLIDIRDISCIAQSATSGISTCQVIDYQGNHKGEGGVGAVHQVISIDENAAEKLVLKVVAQEHLREGAYSSIRLLHEKVQNDHSLGSLPLYYEYPELMGLPFMVFKATDALDGEEVVGMLMHDLSAYGYEDMGTDEWNVVNYLSGTSLGDRVFMAYQYARSVAYLHDHNFIHCDLKEQSVFIDKERPSLTLIDFDGGFSYDKQKSGLTIGAVTAWMPRFIKKALRLGKSAKDFSPDERLREEYFYVATGIYNIIFGVAPYFFLRDGEEETIIEYLKGDKWPYCDSDGDLVNAANKLPHDFCVQLLEQLKAEGYEQLVNAFMTSFNKGYKDEKKRLTAGEWELILRDIVRGIIGAPQVLGFRSDKTVIKSKQEAVQFHWQGKYFKYATMSGREFGILETGTTVYPPEDATLTLGLAGYFGNEQASVGIKAEKIDPQISFFGTSVQKRSTLDPVVLSWDCSHCQRVQITSHSGDLPPKGMLIVDPREKTVYTLTAFGNFDQEITAQAEIDVLQPVIIEFRYEINIEHGIDNVDLFWATEDALSVEITPRPGKVAINGFVQVGIPDRTEFTLTAQGHFGSTTKTIEAKPFPLPLIKTLLVPTPDLKLDAFIPMKELEIPKEFLSMHTMEFDSSINFNPAPDFSKLDIRLRVILESVTQPPVTDELLRKIFDQNNNHTL